MERIERLKLAIERGYKYDPNTGDITTPLNNVVKRKTQKGYLSFGLRDGYKRYNIRAHQFAWFCVNKEVVESIDHINRIKTDNRICNLRSVSVQQNQFNLPGNGYCKTRNDKYAAYIKVNRKKIHLGTFDTEQEAHDAYIKAKLLNHII